MIFVVFKTFFFGNYPYFMFYMYMLSLQNIHTISEEKRKRKKKPQPREKFSTGRKKPNTIVDWSKKYIKLS